MSSVIVGLTCTVLTGLLANLLDVTNKVVSKHSAALLQLLKFRLVLLLTCPQRIDRI